MSLADFVNRIVSTLPGVVFEEIGTLDGWLECTISFAHHRYWVEYDTETKDHWDVTEDFGVDDLKRTTFSNRIEGLLNGLKRNEAGEMVNPEGVVSRG